MSSIVGVDVGDSRIGLSISDGNKKIAFPLGVVERVGGSYGFNKISKLIEDREVEAFVVGLPVRSDGTLGEQAEKVLQYVNHMREYFHLDVFTWDERYTTVIAEKTLSESNVKQERRRKVVDEIAAQIILQSYLDSVFNKQSL